MQEGISWLGPLKLGAKKPIDTSDFQENSLLLGTSYKKRRNLENIWLLWNRLSSIRSSQGNIKPCPDVKETCWLSMAQRLLISRVSLNLFKEVVFWAQGANKNFAKAQVKLNVWLQSSQKLKVNLVTGSEWKRDLWTEMNWQVTERRVDWKQIILFY